MMSYLFNNYKRDNIEFVDANQNELIDKDNNVYLDFSSGIGVTNLGFNMEIYQAVYNQLNLIWHSPNLYLSSIQEEVAQKLIGQRDYLAFFCNSGTEANEAAIKLARKATGKSEIIAFKKSFHGRTYGAMSATGQKKITDQFGPVVPGFKFAIFNDFNSFKSLTSNNTAAVIIEIIQGESGVLPADPLFMKQLNEYCKQKDILIIVDEVQTGIGRTGKLYAHEHYQLSPDIITLAKGLGNGLPIGAMLGKKNLGHAFVYGSHGTTFGGNRLSLAAANQTLSIINDADLLNDVQSKGQFLIENLRKSLVNKRNVIEVRGVGLMVGIEVTNDPSQVVREAKRMGLIILTAGKNVIRLLPPLTITKKQLEKGIEILTEII
ncbi:acetylornithine transaminase [Staphylococcus epidermidis]|jgi:acetylornithine transaminase|uniref:acetylornithine transaminase n=1 Tax=Staphylococcus TaxID=1279 RepID=UPI00021AAD1E|nr:acetylornithine transaminase [Staphylococcus epidermidis]EHR92121.1 acetylornithine transaminase [Staphylococcus epidermidis VCU123]EGS74960.1 acetylornithine transaminase [Staphylococcus epidermidis VCU105]EJE01183.1 putative succinylornithine transaminase [Staphylococcus epidermidis NIHLM039]KAB2271712.1 acetylornithine transaminase [Staphylococcus epidermidis]MBC2922236.1 acetylornithine transaminase [Staphylococcus epidermidis]